MGSPVWLIRHIETDGFKYDREKKKQVTYWDGKKYIFLPKGRSKPSGHSRMSLRESSVFLFTTRRKTKDAGCPIGVGHDKDGMVEDDKGES